MIVNSLHLTDFRNYGKCSVELGDTLNIFIGDNAQGKTNLLESIYLISTTRSHRHIEDTDMIREGCEAARIILKMEENGVSNELMIVISKEGKKLLIQKQPIRRTSEFIGRLNAVLFSPGDFELLDGSPRIRRRFMDMEIGKVRPSYLQNLNSYQKLLRERNAVLKEEKIDLQYLDVLTEQLADYSLKICRERTAFFNAVNRSLSVCYEKISGESLSLKVVSSSFVREEDDLSSLLEKYEKSKERDIFLKQTCAGIHRDDYAFFMKDKEIGAYASQGQKRMTILSLKTSLLEYVKENTGREAVLLLDDVLSELDSERQKNLMKMLPKGTQTIITTTDISDIQMDLPEKTRIFEIKEGRITSAREV